MGLDTSHDCWHGAYSAFMRWRVELARAAGLPPLELMDGFFVVNRAVTGNPFWQSYESDKKMGYLYAGDIWSRLPIKWSSLKDDPLHELLHHSDCDGSIPYQSCKAIAKRLEELLPLLPEGDGGGHIGDWRAKTQQFIDGLRLAASKRQNVKFR